MRALFIVALLRSVAAADPPTKHQAEQAAQEWIKNGETALATSADPFLFDHDNKACKKLKKAREIIHCLLEDESTYSIRNWAPARVRVHTDASFATWQRDPKRDVIARHRKQLAKMTDTVFVHFDAPGDGGTWEMVLPVKLVDDEPAVVGYLANFLPGTKVDELEARPLASNWVRGMADTDDSRRSTAHRTGYPFWALGLPQKGCKSELRAKDTKQFAELAECVADAPQHDLLGMLPHSKWEVVDDPATIKTRADDDHFAAALPALDRLAHDHLLLYNRTSADGLRFEIVLAIRRDGDSPIVDAVVANLY